MSDMVSDMSVDNLTANTEPHYEPFGWHHWPEHPWKSYQFRRALGEVQAGGGSVSEAFQAASRMVPGDDESWFVEWRRLADRADERGRDAFSAGHVNTARDAWLRAVDYYRSAEFFLAPDDPRRLDTFTRCEQAFGNAGQFFRVPVESVKIPYENGSSLSGYFLGTHHPSGTQQPTLIAFGGLDSFKEELYFMIARGVLDRGVSCLLVDGPGQGAALRRHNLTTRVDYEVPVGACIDYLLSRDDVDATRIAVSGSSLGGYYAARAGSKDHRLAAAISHGAIWDLGQSWAGQGEDFGLAEHIKWVFGVPTMAAAQEIAPSFTLNGVLEEMTCPYLIVHGGHDVLGVRQATQVADYARNHGLDVTLRVVDADETGAEHCQHDNPTLGMELVGDWLVDVLGVTEAAN